MFASFERGNCHRGMHVGRRADPDNVEIGKREQIRPVPHRRGMRQMFVAKFFAAFVSRIRNGDDLDVGMFFQCGQMPLPHDAPRSDDSDSQFVIIFVHEFEIGLALSRWL
jgi:hypothetical protein